jgi:hypothetical protein
MPQPEVSEGIVDLTHALVEAQHLRAWFYALERLPVSVRETAFSEMVSQMRSAGEDASLTEAVASLTNPMIYQGVLQAVRERVGDATSHT